MLSVLSLTAVAQKTIALLEPRTGEGSTAVTGLEKNMVRGELRKAIVNFPEYEAITRSDIDQMMKEQNFQRTGMVNDAQIKKLGEISGADYICVSTLTKSKTEFYLEAYLIHLESGRMLNPASQYGELVDGKFANLFPACKLLANEILQHAYINYVNLGLPSGTLWKVENEDCGLITFDQANKLYQNNIPTKEQWEELKKICHWTWTERGYQVEGNNGESIFLPAAGFRYCTGELDDIGFAGDYWSATPHDSNYMWYLTFGKDFINIMNNGPLCCGCSVRLVK